MITMSTCIVIAVIAALTAAALAFMPGSTRNLRSIDRSPSALY
jgi:hypothetical protein